MKLLRSAIPTWSVNPILPIVEIMLPIKGLTHVCWVINHYPNLAVAYSTVGVTYTGPGLGSTPKRLRVVTVPMAKNSTMTNARLEILVGFLGTL